MTYANMFTPFQQQMLQNSYYNPLSFQSFPLMPSNNNIQNLLCFQPQPQSSNNLKQQQQANLFDMKQPMNIAPQVKIEEGINQKASSPSNSSEYHPTLEEVSKERKEFSEFFGKMYEELYENWNKQLEFIKSLRDMNQPENAMSFPMMDKVNPVIAGVLTKTRQISENTLKVMQRTHRLIKSKATREEPLRRQSEKQSRARVSDINVKREFEGKEEMVDKKRKMIKMAQERENKIAIEQVIKFIVDGEGEEENSSQ